MIGRALRPSLCRRAAVAAALLILAAPAATLAQDHLIARWGQRVAPIYEGWMENPDGTFELIFGYYNLNSEEIIDVPIGPDNSIEPGGPDYGQPAHFFPRRSRFTFTTTVPADFGDQELVWKVTANGHTEYAFGTLKPDYIIDERIMMMNNGGFGGRGQRLGEPDNVRPSIRIEGSATRTVKVGHPLPLVAYASDDGNPRGGIGNSNDLGLGSGWFIYRGRDPLVTLEPAQEHPEYREQKAIRDRLMKTAFRTDARTSAATTGGGASQIELPPPEVVSDRRVPVTATFNEPGTYVLRAMAHDGGAGCDCQPGGNRDPLSGRSSGSGDHQARPGLGRTYIIHTRCR